MRGSSSTPRPPSPSLAAVGPVQGGDTVVTLNHLNTPSDRLPLSLLAAVGSVQDGDAVVTFNFRADRMVEISQALEYPQFDKFDRKRWPNVSLCVCVCERVWEAQLRSVRPGHGAGVPHL